MLRVKHNQSPASQLLVEAEHKSELPLISGSQSVISTQKATAKPKSFSFMPSATSDTEPLRLETKVLICVPKKGLRAAHSSRLAPLNLCERLYQIPRAPLGKGNLRTLRSKTS